ncbi:hypothetical protein [Sorangium sp. So ce385]|uniref:hypothetical protein n=1 Tax=Sorangium sp. So ce385 TaxID=3133308 RepID=UPI003F5B6315
MGEEGEPAAADIGGVGGEVEAADLAVLEGCCFERKRPTTCGSASSHGIDGEVLRRAVVERLTERPDHVLDRGG